MNACGLVEEERRNEIDSRLNSLYVFPNESPKLKSGKIYEKKNC